MPVFVRLADSASAVPSPFIIRIPPPVKQGNSLNNPPASLSPFLFSNNAKTGFSDDPPSTFPILFDMFILKEWYAAPSQWLRESFLTGNSGHIHMP
jgi:hypothetical protein